RVRTAGGYEFRADQCVVALPMTTLRHIRFAPPLPANLEAARRELPYARIAKFFLAFPRRSWPENLGIQTAEAGFLYHPTKGQRGVRGGRPRAWRPPARGRPAGGLAPAARPPQGGGRSGWTSRRVAAARAAGPSPAAAPAASIWMPGDSA